MAKEFKQLRNKISELEEELEKCKEKYGKLESDKDD